MRERKEREIKRARKIERKRERKRERVRKRERETCFCTLLEDNPHLISYYPSTYLISR